MHVWYLLLSSILRMLQPKKFLNMAWNEISWDSTSGFVSYRFKLKKTLKVWQILIFLVIWRASVGILKKPTLLAVLFCNFFLIKKHVRENENLWLRSEFPLGRNINRGKFESHACVLVRLSGRCLCANQSIISNGFPLKMNFLQKIPRFRLKF